jgi:hypothetical protein
MEHLVDVGIEGEPCEEGTSPVLCKLQGICIVACEGNLYVVGPFM